MNVRLVLNDSNDEIDDNIYLRSGMLLIVRAFYHLRKPRVITPVDVSFFDYKKALRKARKDVHLESVKYMQQIEDNYLQEHKQAMKKQHFQNQCSFRKQIFTDAFRLFENQIKWKQEDQRFTASLNKLLHDEDVRKINRSRIIKIMEHQSTNYWFNSQNVDNRLQQQTIFPQYVASSEYYYKLFAEALAYELGDFYELHMITSNEEIIREKNKYLIPLYLTLRNKITSYTKDQVKELTQKHAYDISLIQNNTNLSAEEAQELQKKITQKFQQSLKELQDAQANQAREVLLRKKIKELISIFKTWKQYTNILTLTSAQVIKNQYQYTSEAHIQRTEVEVLRSMKGRKTETFVDSIEEDTEQVEMTFEEYLAKVNEGRKERQVSPGESASLDDLESLMAASVNEASQVADPIFQRQGEQLQDMSSFMQPSSQALEVESVSQLQDINPLFFNPKETTTSVQILKEEYRDNEQMLALLNQLGQIDVRYPKLFEQIWKSCNN